MYLSKNINLNYKTYLSKPKKDQEKYVEKNLDHSFNVHGKNNHASFLFSLAKMLKVSTMEALIEITLWWKHMQQITLRIKISSIET